MGRAAVWLSAGLLGGAVFAGGFFIGKRAEPERAFAAPDRSAAIASFAGGKVTADELRAAVEEQGPLLRGSFSSLEARRRLVGELIRQKLLERASREKGYDRTPEIVREHHRALVAFYLRKELEEPESKLQVSDDDLRSFLEHHKAEYERPERVRVADLFLAAPATGAGRRKKAAEAEGLLRRLEARGGKDRYAFANLARLRHLLRGRVVAERRVKDQEAFFAALEKNAGVRFDDEALAGLGLDKGLGPSAAR
ncbi:MAG TPA: hypothetical protein VN874_00415 [Myxococcales bacterium]|nr:hypothetical protein [Myxococcales bacterium]